MLSLVCVCVCAERSPIFAVSRGKGYQRHEEGKLFTPLRGNRAGEKKWGGGKRMLNNWEILENGGKKFGRGGILRGER